MATIRTTTIRPSPVLLAARECGGHRPKTLSGTCSLVIMLLPTEGFGCADSQSPQVALGRAIRLRREEIGLTQEALADAADLDPTSIRGVERGIANPTWDVADRIARALGLALHELARRANELETADRRPTNQPLPDRG